MKNFNTPAVKELVRFIITAALIFFGITGYVGPQIAEVQTEARGGAPTRFNSPVTFQVGATVQNGLTADTVTTTGAATLASLSNTGAINTGSITSTGIISAASLTVAGATTFLSSSPIASSESITPNESVPLTLTAEFITLTPSGAAGVALAACTTGKRAVVYNSINASVVITDTGNFIGAGNATLTQFDTLALVCIATKWVQVGTVPNN